MELDKVLNSATRNVEGFRGYMSLLSQEDLNMATVVTLWRDEETLEKTSTGTIRDAIRNADVYLEGPPTIQNFRVYSTELFQRSE